MKKNPLTLAIDNIKQNKIVFYISIIIFFICHAYCFMNITYSHDSLMIYQNDGIWQISLGRFLQPLYCVFRGCISAPLLIGTIEFIFAIISCFLIIEIIEIKEPFQKILAISILLTSTTLTLTNATYIFESDIYMLALLFATAGAYVAIKNLKFSFVTIIFFVASLGLYQAYLQVGVVLLMFDIFKDIINNKDFKKIIKNSVIYIALILSSLIIYFIFFKLCLHIFHIKAANTYNGLSNVGVFGSFKNIIVCFLGTYKYAIRGLLKPVTILTYNKFKSIPIIIIILISTSLIIFQSVKNKLSKVNIICLVLLLLLLPFGFNFVYFITQGMEHDLMTYSFCVVPLFAFFLIRCSILKSKIINGVLYTAFLIIVFNNIIYANQIYVKKNLERESTLSIVTRIIDRIEQTEGYTPLETPVVLIGGIENNPYLSTVRRGFTYEGTGNSSTVTATSNLPTYFYEYLSYPIKFATPQHAPDEILSKIQLFPAKGCTIMHEGILYIKLSD